MGERTTQQSWSEKCINHPGMAQTHSWHWLFKYWTTEGGNSPSHIGFSCCPISLPEFAAAAEETGDGSKLHSPGSSLSPVSGWVGSCSLHLGCFSDATCSKHAIPTWKTFPLNVPDCRTGLQPFHKSSLDIWDISHIFTGSRLNWKWKYCLAYI